MRRVRLLAAAVAAAMAVVAGPAGAAIAVSSRSATPIGQQPSTWNFQQADVAAAQSAGHDGAGVVVAVVDGWVDASHPDFIGSDGASRVLPGADCRSGSCIAGPASPDACGHGTHVAGVVASSRYGVAPDATILPVVALSAGTDNECNGSASAVAAAIDWATTHGAQVINLSLADDGGPGLLGGPEVTSAIDVAAARGILVVVAAGNDGASSGGPGYGTHALVVAATGPRGGIASYSDQGSNVQLAAPGGDNGGGVCTLQTCIASTWLDHEYALLAGTSMAAPAVSGAAALVLGAFPSAGRDRLVVALESTARPLSGTRFGLLDAAAAVRLGASLRTASRSAPTPTSRVTPANEPPGTSSAPNVPAPRTLSVHQAPSASSQDGFRGPWVLAIVLLVAVSVALGRSAPALLRRER